MEEIVLDFTSCNYIGEVYQVIKKGLGFPNYFGENLDALWDCLGDYCEAPMIIKIKGIQTLTVNKKGWKDYIDKIVAVFDEFHQMESGIVFEYIS